MQFAIRKKSNNNILTRPFFSYDAIFSLIFWPFKDLFIKPIVHKIPLPWDSSDHSFEDKIHQWHQQPDMVNFPTTVAKYTNSPDIKIRIYIYLTLINLI